MVKIVSMKFTKKSKCSGLFESVKYRKSLFVKNIQIIKNIIKLFIQVGDGYADHANWGRPEDMTMARPAYSITTSKPGMRHIKTLKTMANSL